MIPQVVDEPRQQGSRTINLSHLKVGLINVNGLTREKSAILAEDQRKWDVLFITETWFCEDSWFANSDTVVAMSTPSPSDKSTVGHWKGGVAALVRAELQDFITHTTSFHCGVSITLGSLCLAGVYLPPSLSRADTAKELSDVPDCQVLAGDFNCRFLPNHRSWERATLIDSFCAPRQLCVLSRDHDIPDHIASYRRGSVLNKLPSEQLLRRRGQTDHRCWLQVIVPTGIILHTDPALAPPELQQATRFCVRKLEKPAIQHLFSEFLEHSLPSYLSPEQHLSVQGGSTFTRID